MALIAKSLVQPPAEYFSSFAHWRCLLLPNQMLIEPCQTIMSKSKCVGWLCEASFPRALMVGCGCMTNYCFTPVQGSLFLNALIYFWAFLEVLWPSSIMIPLWSYFITLMTYVHTQNHLYFSPLPQLNMNNILFIVLGVYKNLDGNALYCKLGRSLFKSVHVIKSRCSFQMMEWQINYPQLPLLLFSHPLVCIMLSPSFIQVILLAGEQQK